MSNESRFFVVNANVLSVDTHGVGYTPFGHEEYFACYRTDSPLEAAKKFTELSKLSRRGYRLRGGSGTSPVMEEPGLVVYPATDQQVYIFVLETDLEVVLRTPLDSISFPHSTDLDVLCHYYQMVVKDFVLRACDEWRTKSPPLDVYLMHHLHMGDCLKLVISGGEHREDNIWTPFRHRDRMYPTLLKELAIYGTDEYYQGDHRMTARNRPFLTIALF